LREAIIILLLLFFNSGKQNETDGEQKNVQRVYGNPFSCRDVGMLGYTLNGYYLVNGSGIAQRFGVAFCQFKLPPGTTKGIT